MQADRNDEHLDRKLEILSRGIQSTLSTLSPPRFRLPNPPVSYSNTPPAVHEDPGPHPDDHIADLESQNEALRRKLDAMERELQCRSPTKSKPRNPSGIAMDSSDAENVGFRLVGLSLESRAPGVAKTPRVKGRKLTARKWDFGEDEEGF